MSPAPFLPWRLDDREGHHVGIADSRGIRIATVCGKFDHDAARNRPTVDQAREMAEAVVAAVNDPSHVTGLRWKVAHENSGGGLSLVDEQGMQAAHTARVYDHRGRFDGTPPLLVPDDEAKALGLAILAAVNRTRAS